MSELDPPREDIVEGDGSGVFPALFALAQSQLFDGAPFVTMSRKFQHFEKVDTTAQPAMFQTEPSEHTTQRTRMPSKRTWFVNWTVYFKSDPSNPDDQPALRMNAFVDQIERLFPSDDEGQQQTLNGLVHHVFIDGDMLKVAGDDDGQGLLVIPLTIIVP